MNQKEGFDQRFVTNMVSLQDYFYNHFVSSLTHPILQMIDKPPQSQTIPLPPSNHHQTQLPPSIGHYTFGKTLGKGTFGKVKEGTHMPTGQRVAIKIIDKNSIEQPEDQLRIQRQVQIMKKVRHPNIVYLYEIIQTDDHVFIISEYAEQGELFSIMSNQVRLKEKAAGKIFYQVLNAVQYLHRLNIAHRDLKPQNILLDSDYNVKLIDFGLSNYVVSGRLLSTACGSPCYAPPEMVAGKAYNGLIGDIWSLGVIFYTMVCGSLPFQETTTKQLYKKVIEGFYVIPSDISVNAIQAIQKMLTTDPQKRISLSQIRKLKFFTQIKESQPDIIGIIVGFHAMPIDNQIIQQMKEYASFSKIVLEDQLKDNQHNSLTALYYLLQKQILRKGNKTISDLQAYLETSPKYKAEYGKESLKKYRKLLFEAEMAKKKERKVLTHRYKTPETKEQPMKERYIYSNDKYRRRVNTEEKKINLSSQRRAPTTLKTSRNVRSPDQRSYDKTIPLRKVSRVKELSPSKEEVQHRKAAHQLWRAYFKSPLQNIIPKTSEKKPKLCLKINENVRRLKERFLRLPNMTKNAKIKKEN